MTTTAKSSFAPRVASSSNGQSSQSNHNMRIGLTLAGLYPILLGDGLTLSGISANPSWINSYASHFSTTKHSSNKATTYPKVTHICLITPFLGKPKY